MPSDSVADFLDRAQASRVLFPEQIEQLIRQPDIPHSDLAALCSYLLGRGVLTQFQADAIRDGRGHDLSFAGYPVIDVIGPCPNGTAYRALHPVLRTPLVLRRLNAASFAPTDDVRAVVDRVRAVGTLTHPNILPVVDAGVFREEAYAVLDVPADSSDLATMLKEVGGAMPGFLAAEYGWAIASALRAIHERGGWHGEVRPGVLTVGPIATKTNPDGTTRRRPAPNAVVKLTETGLVPVRPPAGARPPAPAALAYLPPERIDGNTCEPRGDIYGLGASLYLLLTGRPPFIGDTSDEVLGKMRTTVVPPLSALRPDLPADLAAFVMGMLARRPEDRPQTASDVCAGLAPFCRPGVLPAPPQPPVVPQLVPHTVPHAVPVEHAESAPAGAGRLGRQRERVRGRSGGLDRRHGPAAPAPVNGRRKEPVEDLDRGRTVPAPDRRRADCRLLDRVVRFAP
ncbi:protein kinase domain-containing protein [Frigoriglobus tundricola]|uniref:Protein kinase domain-containing protein n=1 Tax=Frigoriglobus tundricola TaxID=2774151 RepID=A0A6M5Z379_9BACT|nr:hypothetical protein [Frigoriglobus tundricola]QJX00878.1 hypothetical protein FTUN_8516 [Frigoriglobus tundricola]